MRARRPLRMSQRVGRVLLVCLLLAAGGGVLWYRHLAEDVVPEAPPLVPDNDTKAQMVTRDFRHVETRLDRTIWVLEARKAEVFEDDARLKTVKITWYGEEEGQLPVVITSATGQVNFRNHDAVLDGEVRIVRADGARLSTEHLFWTDAEKTLRAPQEVLIESDTLTIRGETMLANLKERWIRLSRQVRGEIRPRVRILPGLS